MNEPLSCPACHGSFFSCAASLRCTECGRSFPMGPEGHYAFLVEDHHDPNQIQNTEYIRHQQTYPIRVYREFLKPLILSHAAGTLLDVGCGLGTEVKEALKDGYDAYGIDLPNIMTYWRDARNDPARFFACSAERLPFCMDSFDLVWSLGVVEHIGTDSDALSLTETYQQARLDYVNELLRVTKPGGKIIVSCPNKSFPIDIQHGPTCGTHFKRLRWFIFNKTKMNVHKTWGEYHLLSYSNAKRLFMQNVSACSVRALPLRNYFGFGKFESGYLRLVRTLVKSYVEHLPSCLLPTFFNPYMLVMIEKSSLQDESQTTDVSR